MSAERILATKQFYALPSPLTVVRPLGHVILPHPLLKVNQNTCLSCCKQTERFDQMSEAFSSSPSLAAVLALANRIERESSRFYIRDVFVSPSPFVEVKDTLHGIVVGFSCEADYVAYCQITARKGA